jgi:hypothetical protein
MLTDSYNVACPDKNIPFSTIPLSGFTIGRRIENIQVNLKMKATNVLWFSIAVDRSTDVGDTMQHVFVRGMDIKFDITEDELAALITMKEPTTC